MKEARYLLIDPSGGIAGDMVVAALISAGADSGLMKKATLAAAEKLGSAELEIKKTGDGATQLHMKLRPLTEHLSDTEAVFHLDGLFEAFDIRENYRVFGKKILGILLDAEKEAHARHNIIIPHPVSTHHHSPGHSHHHHSGTFLHEAQDIIIDILGTVMGMQILEIEPRGMLLNPVAVGGGAIDFSHGLFTVPAPATEIILKEFDIPWEKGPIDRELCTPTGAAILAALGAQPRLKQAGSGDRNLRKGKARGSGLYDIPALEIFFPE